MRDLLPSENPVCSNLNIRGPNAIAEEKQRHHTSCVTAATNTPNDLRIATVCSDRSRL